MRLSSSSTHAVTITPAEPQAAFRSYSPVTTAFPVASPGRLPHHPFRGLLSVQSNYGPHVRRVPYRTLYTRGFSRFVTSTTAPVATGRSESCRAGFAPAGKQRLCTAHEAPEVEDSQAPVRQCQRYLSHRHEQLDYYSALARDLPIGSGEIESAHRYLVQQRLKRPGAWWRAANAEHMLALRLNRANRQWNGYWAAESQQAA